MKIIYIFIVSTLLLYQTASSEVIFSTSAARADIAQALNSAADGDTILIPEGITNDWTETLHISKAVYLKGSGDGLTILNNESDGPLIEFNLEGGKTYEISDLTVDGGGGSGTVGAIHITGDGRILIHDMTWTPDTGRPITCKKTSVTGVIYNCVFNDQKAGIYVRHENWNGGTNGDGSWERDVDWGGDGFLFIEDCVFNVQSKVNVPAVDGNGGARVVLRNNVCENVYLLFHGNDSSNQQRSGRAMEVYGNQFDWNISDPKNAVIVARGGTYLAHGNTITGNYTDTVVFQHYVSNGNSHKLWQAANFRSAWAEADLSDGVDTPGGAGDGVFESGISSGAVLTSSLADSSKNWQTDEWSGYNLVLYESFECAASVLESGGTVSVSSNLWSNGQWTKWSVVNDTTGHRWEVASNTSNSLTLMGSPYPSHNIQPGDTFTPRTVFSHRG